MDNNKDFKKWLRRAKSSLVHYMDTKTEDLYYEELCFDCHQAAEKTLIGLLVHLGLDFPRTHSFEKLLDLLMKRISIPEHSKFFKAL